MHQPASPTLPEYADFILEFCQEARKVLSSDEWKKEFDSKTKCDVCRPHRRATLEFLYEVN